MKIKVEQCNLVWEGKYEYYYVKTKEGKKYWLDLEQLTGGVELLSAEVTEVPSKFFPYSKLDGKVKSLFIEK